jgi:hypothetical protein
MPRYLEKGIKPQENSSWVLLSGEQDDGPYFLIEVTPSLMCYSVCIFLQKKSKRGNPALIGAGGNHFLRKTVL